LAKKIMFFIQTSGKSNSMESAGTGCKTDAKVVADEAGSFLPAFLVLNKDIKHQPEPSHRRG
jgi:hypothetical protein